MDCLLDYGDLGAIVRAGFSTSNTSLSSSPPIANKLCSQSSAPPYSVSDEKTQGPSTTSASNSSFPGFHSSLSSSFQLPSLSTAFDLLPPLPSPAPFHFPYYGPSEFWALGSSAHTLGASPSLRTGFLKKLDLCGGVCASAVQTMDSNSSLIKSASSMGPHVWSSEAAMSQQRSMLSTLCQKILDTEEPLASAKSNTHAPSGATERPLQAPTGVFSPSISRSFLCPLPPIQDMEVPLASTTTNSASAGGAEKRGAETELASSANVSNPNRGGRGAKRRKLLQKRVVQVPAIGAASSKPSAGENVPSDMWAWRKYGQKPIKGSPHPRGYYRCSSSKGCPARKQVERNPDDPSMLVVTYTSDHNHTWPTHRISTLSGSTRSSTAKSPSSPCGIHELSPISGANEPSPYCDISNSPLSVGMDDGPSASPLSHEDTPDLSSFQDADDANLYAMSPTFSNTSASFANHMLPGACNVMNHDVGSTGSGRGSSSTPLTMSNDRMDAWTPDASMAVRNSELDRGELDDADATDTSSHVLHNGWAWSPSFATSQACVPVSMPVPVQAEEEAQVFDTLLSEMLEEVQRQNKANVGVMMGEDDEDLLFNWSNSSNFSSQVNHLVQ